MSKNFKRIIFICVFSVFGFANLLLAQTAKEFFELGKKAYLAQNYQKAKNDFMEAGKANYGAIAYHNAANADVKLNKFGEALLNYERARYLNPRTPETLANIDMLKKKLNISSGKKNFYDIVLGELSNSQWITLACVSFWIALFALVLPPLFKNQKSSYKFLGWTFACVFIVSVAGTIYWSEMRNTAISISSDALLKLSPAENAPNVAPLLEGKSAIIRNEHNGYMLLQTRDGKWGWAKDDLIKKVIP